MAPIRLEELIEGYLICFMQAKDRYCGFEKLSRSKYLLSGFDTYPCWAANPLEDKM